MDDIINNFVNSENIIKSSKVYGKEGPFDHAVIDGFFNNKTANLLEKEFPDYNDDCWHKYDNKIENKKTCNNWNAFPPNTYRVFSFLNSNKFVNYISEFFHNNNSLFSDSGLNGGGWHIHNDGGILNPHLDYSLHPKLYLQRKLNIIIYLSKGWKRKWGGGLGLWSDKNNSPDKLEKKIYPKFNRAIIFDTTQNSWHGLPDPVLCGEKNSRKSIAVYYLCNPDVNVDKRGKALFAPLDDQKEDNEILNLIKTRASSKLASKVYKN